MLSGDKASLKWIYTNKKQETRNKSQEPGARNQKPSAEFRIPLYRF